MEEELRHVFLIDNRDASHPEDLKAVQMQLASGTLFQVDQETSAHQEVLRAFREFGEDSNLDSHIGLRSCGHRQKAIVTRAELVNNTSEFKCDAFQENSHFTGYFTDGLQHKY